MGKVVFGRECTEDFIDTALKLLCKVHGAIVIERYNEWGESAFHVEGTGIPVGRVNFSFVIREVVPNVVTVELWP